MDTTIDRRAPARSLHGQAIGSDTATSKWGLRPTHRTDVQGLRGLAVILVVAFHAEVLTSGGFVGVDAFFVISGFVITISLHRELERTQRIDFAAFYTRRVKRLLPALAVTLVVAGIISAALLSPLGPQLTAAKTGMAAALFSSNLSLYLSPSGYFGAPAAVNPLLHMWSLSVEEQFYFAYPIVLAVLWRFLPARRGSTDDRRRSLVIALSIVGAGSFLLSVVLTRANGAVFGIAEPARLAFYTPVTRAWEFIAGGLLALMSPRLFRISRSLAGAIGIVGLALIAFAAFRFDEFTRFPGVAALLPVVGTVLMILSGSVDSGRLQRVLSHRWLVWIGDVSYGWYLWHWPMIVAARVLWPDTKPALLAAAVVSLVPAVISYRLIENRIRFARSMGGRRVIGLAAVCILVPFAVLAALRSETQAGWHSAAVKNAQTQLGLHIDEVRGCSSTASLTDPACTFAPRGTSRGTIALVGDSNAGHFSEGVIAAANELGYTVQISTSSGCPFVDLEVALIGVGYDTWCTNHVREVSEQLVSLHPHAVIVASASDRYLGEATSVRVPGSDQVADTATGMAEFWQAGLTATIERLTVADIKVLVTNPAPRFVEFDPSTRCGAVQLISDPFSCGATRSRADAAEERALAVNAEAGAVAAAGTGSDTFDPFEALCTGDPCATNTADTWLFRDHAHLSIPGAESLTPHFRSALVRLINGTE